MACAFEIMQIHLKSKATSVRLGRHLDILMHRCLWKSHLKIAKKWCRSHFSKLMWHRTDLNSAIVDIRVQPGAEATKDLLDNIGHTSDTRIHSKTQ